MANETELKTSPLIPLEYCSPERAARLLGCEVEDIFHWAAIGAIELYAIFDQYQVEFTNSNIVPDSNNIHISQALTDKAIEPIDLGLGLKVLSYGPQDFKYGAKIDIYKKKRGSIYDGVFLSGLWLISQFNISKVKYTTSLEDELNWDLSAIYLGRASQEEPLHISLWNVAIDDMGERIRVVRDDLLTIRDHMLSGQPMVKNTSAPLSEKKPIPATEHAPHPTAESHALKREQVYAAAIHARELWPDDCKTATAWAETLANHSFKLFGEDHPPLSQETMARMLGKAIREGVPRRKR